MEILKTNQLYHIVPQKKRKDFIQSFFNSFFTVFRRFGH